MGSSRSLITTLPAPALQRFLFRTQDVADVDRRQLQQDIIELVLQHGALAVAAAGGRRRMGGAGRLTTLRLQHCPCALCRTFG